MADKKKGIKIVAILGSMRPDNYTAKALSLVVDEFRKQEDVSIEVIDPAEIKLNPPGKDPDGSIEVMQNVIRDATGIVMSTPEYHGSYSSVIKLVIENMGFPSGFSGKPVALLGVAAGQIGAIKALEHLRSVCSHIGSIVLPGPVSVANVNSVFDAEGNCTDAKIEERIRGVATQLLDYIHENICPRRCLEEFVRPS